MPLTANPASAVVTTTKITASDYSKNARYGTSVASSTDGNTVLVGGQARTDSGGVTQLQSGAYVNTKSGGVWSQTAELFPSPGEVGDRFGRSVALSADGNTAVVGAPGATVSSFAGAGAVYIFN